MKIVVTGFGPFGDHKTNASWQAVQALPNLWKLSEHKDDVELVVDEVPVSYDFIKTQVPNKYGEVDFVVHVGVSSLATNIVLETCANNTDYHRDDVNGCCPSDEKCDSNLVDNTLKTCLDIDTICKELNCENECENLVFSRSDDAGRYLCEFIYYSSLWKKEGKCLFIHVPPLNSPYTQEQLTKCLLLILKKIINSLQKP